MLAHVNDAVPPIREMLPGIELSPELEAIVERCVSKNPAHRFESMDALLRALTVIGGGPLTESLVSGRFSSSPPGFPGGRGPDSAPSSAGSRPPESGAAYTSGTYSGHFVPTQSGTHPGRGSEPPAAALDSPSATTPSSFPSMGSIPDSSGPTSIKVLMPSATPAPMSQAALSSPARSSRLPWLLAAAAGLVAVVAIGLSLRSRDTGEAGSSATRSIAADATAAEPRTTSRAADAPSVAASTAGQPTGQGAPIPSGAASSTPLPHASVASPKATAKLPPAQSPGKAAGAASAQTKTPSGYKASPY
jgi:serine/threonine protein kinase